MKTRYSVIGLGKLGASMAAAIASRGFEVIGVDVNETSVRLMNEGHAPVSETGLEELIAANTRRLRATTSHEEAVLASDISFVIVPTPSNQQGAFSIQYAAWAFKAIGRALKRKNEYHNVVLTSTVLPGASRYGLLPVLEAESGKKCGPDFGFCYSPEFIALGSTIRDFLNPDFTLLGQFDDRCGEHLEKCYEDILERPAPCRRMTLENAELTKIAVNTFVTTKIAFANMLAGICETIPGGNIDVVSDALGLDTRIGRRYLTGALGYGGPCFPRDNVALAWFARARGVAASLAQTTDAANRSLADRIADQVRNLVGQGKTVAVLGLSYKPKSHVIEESQAINLARALASTGARVVGYDPLANAAARTALAYHAVVVDTMKDCVSGADCVVVSNPDDEFKSLTAEMILTNGQTRALVIDFWRILACTLGTDPRIRYIPFGCSVNDEANSTALQGMWGAAIPA
jgi:UDPglucose 6-dehydrogenase